MHKAKKIIAGIFAATMMLTAAAVSVSAATPRYIDGDREVKYFVFSFDGNYVEGSSSTVVKRHAGRNFVVSVNSFSGPSYAVKYCMGEPNSGSAYSPAVSLKGTGNTGGSFYSNSTAGVEMCLVGEVDSRDFGKTIAIGGQFSPDAAS